jgi:fucose permease
VLGGAAIAAAVAIAALRLAAPVDASHPRAARAGTVRVLRQRGLAWVAAVVLLGAGTEASMAGFTSTYLTSLGIAPATATWVLSMHWVGLIAGRLVFAGRVDREKAKAILVASLAAAAGVVMFVSASSWMVLVSAPFAIGLAIAIIMPTALALGGERHPQSAGTLFGVLLALAQAGAMALPAIIGVTADAAGVRWAMSIVAINNVLIAGICLKLRSKTLV